VQYWKKEWDEKREDKKSRYGVALRCYVNESKLTPESVLENCTKD